MELLLPIRARLAKLFAKRDAIATENFVRCLVDLGHTMGYQLDQSDRCFIHPEDVPASVKLTARDPVVISSAPAMMPGQLLFARSREIPACLFSPPIITAKQKGLH